MKNILLAIISVAVFAGCAPTEKKQSAKEPISIQGEAQGSTYSILYFPDGDTIQKSEIDSILKDIDFSLSAWEPASLLNELNNSDSTEIVFDDYHGYFTDMVKYSREVYKATDGVFDPTIAPLVDAWGFGFKGREEMNQMKVDSLLELVGFTYDNIRLTRFDDRNALDPKRILVKSNDRIKFDFNSIAQGYSVDVLGEYLDVRNANNYLIELGGEMLAKGQKPDGGMWNVGIDKPVDSSERRQLNATLQLQNEAIATSGNYRKFYIKDGVKYAHTLDPKTGYPVRHNLLSATVVANKCWKADAFATAFMVMGIERTKKFLMDNQQLNLGVYLIFDNNGQYETFISENLKERLKEIED